MDTIGTGKLIECDRPLSRVALSISTSAIRRYHTKSGWTACVLSFDRCDSKFRTLGFSGSAWAQADEKPNVVSKLLIAAGGRARSQMEGRNLSAN